jgi:WD40 repeat protein
LSQKKVEKHSAFKCSSFGASFLEDRHLATGDFEGRVSMWDLQKLELPVWTVKGHSQIVNCIDGIGGLVGGGAPEIVTGSRDGS